MRTTAFRARQLESVILLGHEVELVDRGIMRPLQVWIHWHGSIYIYNVPRDRMRDYALFAGQRFEFVMLCRQAGYEPPDCDPLD